MNIYVIAVLGAMLIVAALVWVMRTYTMPQDLGAERATYRAKNLVELRAANQEILYSGNYAWQDAKKGMVRLPISRAKELMLQIYRDPANGRTNIIGREEKLTAVPPPISLE
jgi:hypothetical protein